MKKLAITAAIMLMVAMPMMAERVKPETARKVATTFLNNNGAKASQLTDLSKAAGFPNLYIFNAEQGFVVMAADDCVQPILGYSLTGKFVAEGMPDNIKGWLQGYSDEIQYAIDNKLRANSETAQLWKDLSIGKPNAAKTTVIVDALIQTRWDQSSPYNNLCPQGSATGCVATAMAQVMKYWNYPTHGIGSHSYIPISHPEYGEQFADFNSTNYDWTNMTNTYNNQSTDTQKQAVATLMYHCGVSVNMKYGPGESGASTYAVMSALMNYFNYNPEMVYESRSDYEDSEWIAMLKAELDADTPRPIQYRGSLVGGSGGHSFVCDGYDERNYFHFNWGWSGLDDGFFPLNALNTSNGNFTDNQAAIFGIEPVHCTAEDPSNLTYSQNGRQITLNWEEAEGASSYNIYRNGSLIDNSTSESYEDPNAPFGSNTYYIRSVDAHDKLSLSSNAITTNIEYNTEGMKADGLQIKYENGKALLQWSSPAHLQYLDYLTFQGTTYYTGNFDRWGARFPASFLTTFSGLSVSSVATYFYTAGEYTANVYQCTGLNPSGDPVATITGNYPKGWQTIAFDTPFILDDTKDLWIVFQCSGIARPTIIGNQSTGDGDYCYYNNSWVHFTGYSFFISANLTDGLFSYNICNNGTNIAEGISANTFEHDTPSDNTVNLYTIKVNQSGNESAVSNWVGLTKGIATISGNLTINLDNMMILAENSTLTVSGTLSNTNVGNLVLEDGAQLIHNTEGVKATVKKSITAYTSNQDGWYFIASPVMENSAPSEVSGLCTDEYDLYYYDEPWHSWRNYKSHSQDFTIEHKKGYLYANGETDGTTLQFNGTLTPSNNSVSVNNLSHSSETLAGFNLVGNPFACYATINQDCYVIEGGRVILATGTKVFSPCEGAFVKADSDEYTVTFTKHTGAKVGGKTNSLDLTISQGKAILDRTRVRFGEGTNLEKFYLDQDNTQISLRQNGQDFAVAYADGAAELPMSFIPSQNGTYTLNIENDGLGLDYLHLIDNLTGNDIDLLATPSYTFEASLSDYTSRFRLVFVCEDTNDDEAFAFYSDGEIRLVRPYHDASLQIVDMMGRVIVSHNGHLQSVSTSGMTAGVYVLRLINGDNVKTQKIVIE